MEIEKQIISKFEKTVSKVFFEERDGNTFLNVELKVSDFDEVIKISKEVSTFIDEIDQTDNEYILDVYSRGTDHEIDLNNLEVNIGMDVKIRLNESINDNQEFIGVLIEDTNDALVIKWNAKGQFRKQEVKKNNINEIKIFAKIGKA